MLHVSTALPRPSCYPQSSACHEATCPSQEVQLRLAGSHITSSSTCVDTRIYLHTLSRYLHHLHLPHMGEVVVQQLEGGQVHHAPQPELGPGQPTSNRIISVFLENILVRF